MKIEEYLESLPQDIISGEDVQLPEQTFRKIFHFVGISEKDIFYHLGCGDGTGLALALEEFNVKKAVGIDNNGKKVELARNLLQNKNLNGKIICQDILNCKLDDATIILFWFADNDIVEKMEKKFEKLKNGCKIITIWGSLPGCLPNKVEFPFILNEVPFRKAKDLQEQLLAVFGVKCIDFVTAWEHAERYTKAITPPDSQLNRFLTIIQTLVIWINAKNLGVECGDEIPESIKTYIEILRTYFDIEVEHLLKN